MNRPNRVSADAFARLCVQANHEPEAIRVTVRKRYPDVDAAEVVDRALEWRRAFDAGEEPATDRPQE